MKNMQAGCRHMYSSSSWVGLLFTKEENQCRSWRSRNWKICPKKGRLNGQWLPRRRLLVEAKAIIYLRPLSSSKRHSSLFSASLRVHMGYPWQSWRRLQLHFLVSLGLFIIFGGTNPLMSIVPSWCTISRVVSGKLTETLKKNIQFWRETRMWSSTPTHSHQCQFKSIQPLVILLPSILGPTLSPPQKSPTKACLRETSWLSTSAYSYQPRFKTQPLLI